MFVYALCAVYRCQLKVTYRVYTKCVRVYYVYGEITFSLPMPDYLLYLVNVYCRLQRCMNEDLIAFTTWMQS